MNEITITGLVASICTGISMLPQLVKIYKEKKPADISWIMLGILITGLAAWVWYGIKKEDPLLIASNAFSLLINITVVILNILFRKRENG